MRKPGRAGRMDGINRRDRINRMSGTNRRNRSVTREDIKDYCDWLYGCEKSIMTIRKYRHHLTLFMEFMKGRTVNKELAILWKTSLRECMSPVTVNGAIAAVNGFLRHYGWEDCTVRFLKVGRSPFMQEDRELSRNEYLKLVECAFLKGKERLALLLQTVCSCGIRISELPFITVEAIESKKAQVECKGRIRTVLLPEKLCRLLEAYAQKKKITEGTIFVTRTGKPLDRSNIWREMKSLGEAAGVGKKKIFPHNLRHLFARTYYAVKKDLSKLADILGHRDVNTTRIYTMERGSEHRRQIESLELLWTGSGGI